MWGVYDEGGGPSEPQKSSRLEDKHAGGKD